MGSSLPPEVPQILINREPLPHCNFDVELLGDCDSIINQICLMLGEDWSSPVHRPRLQQHTGLPPQYYKAKEASSKQDEEKDDESQKKNTVIGEEKSDVGEPIKAGVSQDLSEKTQDDPASDDLPKMLMTIVTMRMTTTVDHCQSTYQMASSYSYLLPGMYLLVQRCTQNPAMMKPTTRMKRRITMSLVVTLA